MIILKKESLNGLKEKFLKVFKLKDKDLNQNEEFLKV